MRRLIRKKSFVRPVFSLVLFLGFIFFFPPENIFYFISFYILLFLTLWQILNIFFDNKKSLAYCIIVIVYLILRQNKIDNILNVLLLLGLLITFEIYFRIR